METPPARTPVAATVPAPKPNAGTAHAHPVPKAVRRAAPPAPEVPRRRILIVDDHPLVCRALADIIGQVPDLEVCGDAPDPRTAITLTRQLRPDLALIDINLQEGNGVDLVKQLKAMAPGLAMVVLSQHDEALYAERVVQAGALGYVNKQESPQVILAAIRRALEGKLYLSDKMSDRILGRLTSDKHAPTADPIAHLSDRELAAFELIGRGKTTRQIAEELCISPKTVETYRQRIKQKLSLSNNSELVQKAVSWVVTRV
jgi:DNA-binding NarL/FixJ family response regulator